VDVELHDQSAQRSAMRDRDRILREWDLDKQCMHKLSPCCSVPQMDDGMQYEERRAGLSCWPCCRVKRKPQHRQSSHDVHGAKVADEMVSVVLLFPVNMPQLEKWISVVEGIPQGFEILFRVANHDGDLDYSAPAPREAKRSGTNRTKSSEPASWIA
jgi:hypothetical protein